MPPSANAPNEYGLGTFKLHQDTLCMSDACLHDDAFKAKEVESLQQVGPPIELWDAWPTDIRCKKQA